MIRILLMLVFIALVSITTAQRPIPSEIMKGVINVPDRSAKEMYISAKKLYSKQLKSYNYKITSDNSSDYKIIVTGSEPFKAIFDNGHINDEFYLFTLNLQFKKGKFKFIISDVYISLINKGDSISPLKSTRNLLKIKDFRAENAQFKYPKPDNEVFKEYINYTSMYFKCIFPMPQKIINKLMTYLKKPS